MTNDPDETDDFSHLDPGPELSPEELAATSPPVEETLVLDTPVSDASGEGGSGPAGDPPAEDTAGAAPEPEKPGQTVPLATHIEDRKAHQAKIEEITAAHEAKMEALLERFSPAPAAAEAAAQTPMPDPVMDPEGFERWLTDRDSKAAEAMEVQRAEAVDAQNFNTARQQETAFKAANPHYEVAFNHLRNSRAQEIKLSFPNMTDEQIIQAVNGEVIGIAKNAVKNGGDAAATLYSMAQTRGWSEPAAEPAPSPAPSAVDQINKASAASKSVGSAPSGGPSRLTAAAIANMSVDEVSALDDRAFEDAMS